jgi:hypothetical protein
MQAVPMPPRRPVYQVAAAESRPAPTPAPRAAPPQAAPVQLAALSPNEIVNMRGLWDSPAEAAPIRTPLAETNALSVSGARRIMQPAAASRETTASIGPFPTQDRVPADIALGYAAQAIGNARTPVKAADRAPAVVTTKGAASIASKPTETIAQSRLMQANERLDDPWLRGLVLASSVQDSLVVTQVGDPDFASFTRFMSKPATSVLMTFSNDPHLGMTAEQFSGSAVVFPATVTFATSRHASLQ